MSERGVLYFNAGAKHCVHLVVSVMSLRDHYGGPVAVVTEADGPGRRCAERMAEDSRLGPVTVIADATMKAGGHGASYLCKTLLPRLSPFDVSLFLDADTLVVASFDELWPDESAGEVVLTRFCDWVSTGGKMRQRILPWSQCEPDRTERMLERPWPAINTGVLSFSRNSEAFCEDWHHTARKRQVWITDETAAQLIFPDHNVRVMDDRFNASVIYAAKGEDVLSRDDVRIYHAHGGKGWKRDTGRMLYQPSYERALIGNFGGICGMAPHRKWFNELPDTDRERLKRYFHHNVSAVS